MIYNKKLKLNKIKFKNFKDKLKNKYKLKNS